VQLVADGLPNAQIAETLSLAEDSEEVRQPDPVPPPAASPGWS